MVPFIIAAAIITLLSAIALNYGWHVVSEHWWESLVNAVDIPFIDFDGEDGDGWVPPVVKTALGVGALVLVAVVLLSARGRK